MAEDKILLIVPGMRCGVGGGNNGSMGRAGLNVGDVHFAFEILLSKLLSLTLMGKKNESKKYFASLQLDIMKNKIPLPEMTWSVKDINTFLQHPLIHSLMTYDTQYNNCLLYTSPSPRDS